MERKQISEECQTFLQLIYERNEENKAKKDAWERKVNHISAKEKAQDQAEIKKHADIAKDEQKCANDCDKIAMQAGTNHRKFALYNDKYQDHMQRAGWSNAEKQDVIDKVRAKYTKTRAVSEECEAFLNMNCMEVSQEAAQKVVNRKIQQLKDSSTSMNQARRRYKDDMAVDGTAVNTNGQMISKDTDWSSGAHKDKIEHGSRLNQGALRILKAGKKAGADVSQLKYAGKGHAEDVRNNAKAHHDIKHTYD